MILHGWDTVEEIEDSFEEPDALKGCQVLFAEYDRGGYSGSAQVIFCGTDGELYEVTGSHCSCYGLENQWSPGRVTIKSLLMRPELDEELRELLISVQVLGVKAWAINYTLN